MVQFLKLVTTSLYRISQFTIQLSTHSSIQRRPIAATLRCKPNIPVPKAVYLSPATIGISSHTAHLEKSLPSVFQDLKSKSLTIWCLSGK